MDEDPAIFAYIIKYLPYSGQQGAAQLLPKDLKERTELRCVCGVYVKDNFPLEGLGMDHCS